MTFASKAPHRSQLNSEDDQTHPIFPLRIVFLGIVSLGEIQANLFSALLEAARPIRSKRRRYEIAKRVLLASVVGGSILLGATSVGLMLLFGGVVGTAFVAVLAGLAVAAGVGDVAFIAAVVGSIAGPAALFMLKHRHRKISKETQREETAKIETAKANFETEYEGFRVAQTRRYNATSEKDCAPDEYVGESKAKWLPAFL